MREVRRHRLGRGARLAAFAGGVGVAWAAVVLLLGGASDARAADPAHSPREDLPSLPDLPVAPAAPATSAPPGAAVVPALPVVPSVPAVSGLPVAPTVPPLPGIPPVATLPTVPGLPGVVDLPLPGVSDLPVVSQLPPLTSVPRLPIDPMLPVDSPDGIRSALVGGGAGAASAPADPPSSPLDSAPTRDSSTDARWLAATTFDVVPVTPPTSPAPPAPTQAAVGSASVLTPPPADRTSSPRAHFTSFHTTAPSGRGPPTGPADLVDTSPD